MTNKLYKSTFFMYIPLLLMARVPAFPALRCTLSFSESGMSDRTVAALAAILTVTTIISLLIVFRLTKGKVKIV